MLILDVPPGLEFAAVSLTMRDTVGGSRSPYTGDLSRVDFGGRWWEATFTTLPLAPDLAAEVDAWLDDLAEPGVAARLPRPVYMTGGGTFAGATVALAADRAPGAVLLSVSGLGAGLTIARGSLVSVGDHMHRVRQTLVGGSGEQLEIVPPLRAIALAGDLVQVGAAVVGLWSLLKRPARTHGREWAARADPISLDFCEAQR
jgi:hypothetical protein